MEIAVIIHCFFAKQTIQREVGIKKKDGYVVSIDYIETYVMVAPFCILNNQTSVFPACSYQFEGRDMRSAAPNLNPWGLQSGVPSNSVSKDISELEDQHKLYLATCKAAIAKRMLKHHIKDGVDMKSSGGYSFCSSYISQYESNVYQYVEKGLRSLLQKVLTSSDVGSNEGSSSQRPYRNSSLQILMEELKPAEQLNASNLMTLYSDSASIVRKRVLSSGGTCASRGSEMRTFLIICSR